jgi:hypothetical protein
MGIERGARLNSFPGLGVLPEKSASQGFRRLASSRGAFNIGAAKNLAHLISRSSHKTITVQNPCYV